jgi:hypothetical protein
MPIKKKKTRTNESIQLASEGNITRPRMYSNMIEDWLWISLLIRKIYLSFHKKQKRQVFQVLYRDD